MKMIFSKYFFGIGLIASLMAGSAMATTPLGSPSCDRFIQSMDQCLAARVPLEDKADLQKDYDQAVTELRASLQDPEKAKQVELACDTVRNTFKVAVQDYGCSL